MELSKERMLQIAKEKEYVAKHVELSCGNCGSVIMQYDEEESAFYEKVIELLEADAEGRLVVLPCAVAEEVEYKSAIDKEKIRKGKVIAISMLLSESVRRMKVQVMIENRTVIPFEKNDFEKRVLRKEKVEDEAALEKMGGGEK